MFDLWKILAVTLISLFAYQQSEAQAPTPAPPLGSGWTVDPEAQFRADKVTFCVDLVNYHYLKLTGIELRTLEKTYVATDTGAEVTGLADSVDERLTGTMHFKCVYDDFMGESMMLKDFDLTEGE